MGNNSSVNKVPVDVVVRVVEGTNRLSVSNGGNVVNSVGEPYGFEFGGLVVGTKELGELLVDVGPETGLGIGIGKAVNVLVVEGIAPELLEDGAVLETGGQLSIGGDPRLDSNLVKSGLSTTHVHVAVKWDLEVVFGSIGVSKTFSVVESNKVGELSVVLVTLEGFGTATASVVNTIEASVGGEGISISVKGGISAVAFNDASHISNGHTEHLDEFTLGVAGSVVRKIIAHTFGFLDAESVSKEKNDFASANIEDRFGRISRELSAEGREVVEGGEGIFRAEHGVLEDHEEIVLGVHGSDNLDVDWGNEFSKGLTVVLLNVRVNISGLEGSVESVEGVIDDLVHVSDGSLELLEELGGVVTGAVGEASGGVSSAVKHGLVELNLIIGVGSKLTGKSIDDSVVSSEIILRDSGFSIKLSVELLGSVFVKISFLICELLDVEITSLVAGGASNGHFSVSGGANDTLVNLVVVVSNRGLPNGDSVNLGSLRV